MKYCSGRTVSWTGWPRYTPYIHDGVAILFLALIRKHKWRLKRVSATAIKGNHVTNQGAVGPGRITVIDEKQETLSVSDNASFRFDEFDGLRGSGG